MELEELKISWGVLNERLQQNEILNQRLVREMIEKKAQSAQSKLLRLDLFGLIVVFAIIVLLPLIKTYTVMLTSSFILLMSVMVIALAVQAYLLYLLLDINLNDKGLVENMKTILRYKLINKRNQTWGAVLGVLAVGGVLLLQGDQLYVNTVKLVSIGIIIPCAFFIGIIQYRFYRNNIASIEKGLRELEEFEKE